MPISWDTYQTALPSIAQAVGRTPLVKLNRVTADVRPPIYLKIEWFGPSGSLKDRIYLHMFDRAEARSELRPGMQVLECSTGNAGIACAFVSAVKGYPCTIVMPEGMSDERKKIMRACGATLVFTPGGESDVGLSLATLEEIRAADPRRYCVPGQFSNADNVEAQSVRDIRRRSRKFAPPFSASPETDGGQQTEGDKSQPDRPIRPIKGSR
jgi:cysteine synthase A